MINKQCFWETVDLYDITKELRGCDLCVCVLLGIQLRVLWILSKHITTELHPQPMKNSSYAQVPDYEYHKITWV